LLIHSGEGPRRLDAVRVVRTLALFVAGVVVTIAVALAGVVVLGLQPILVRFARRRMIVPTHFGHYFPEVVAKTGQEATTSPK
jgi:hypothetical protein